MAKNRDGTEVVVDKSERTPHVRPTRPLRILEIRHHSFDDYYWHCTDRNGTVLYHSAQPQRKDAAKKAAIREHQGRTNYEYVLKWIDERSGKERRETL